MATTENDSNTQLSKFKTKPFNHQLEYLNKHGRTIANALLADMGTGKTWMVINNVADLWSSKDCDGMLVFAPNGVHLNWTAIELPKHMPDWVRWRAAAWTANPRKAEKEELECLFDDPTSGELRILTMNWEALQHKRSFEFAKKFCNCFRRLMIVCDESDAASNPKALRTKNLMKLKPYSHWRRIMTGTPIDGTPFSAFAQFSFLDESILGTTSYYAFKAEYSELLDNRNPLIRHLVNKKVKFSQGARARMVEEFDALKKMIISNGRDNLIEHFSSVEMAFNSDNYENLLIALDGLQLAFDPKPNKRKDAAIKLIVSIQTIVNEYLRKLNNALTPGRLPQIVAKDKEGLPKYRNLDKLSKLIAPYSFRVLKSECLDLPKKIYKTALFDLTPQQREVYNKAKKECRIVFENNESPFNKMVAVTKLAQITSGYYIHPMAEEPVRIPGDNPKLELLAERVQAILAQGKKVIIWARYRVEIEDIVQKLVEATGLRRGEHIVEYHGGVKKADRKANIDAMEHGDAVVWVGNQQSGGTGITIVSASYTIYFSNDYSLRNRKQSEDRNHRIGQEEDVVYVNLAARGTVDEKVVKALLNKENVADIIVNKGLLMLD